MSTIALTPNDYVKAAKTIGVEYLSVTGDTMFKRIFVLSDDAEKVKTRRNLLIKSIVDIVSCLDRDNKLSKLVDGSSLSKRKIENETIIQEVVSDVE